MAMKKGQSAMEYLMTYGWAILVIVLVLAVLFYLGVFSPRPPAVCSIGAPFSCIDSRASASSGVTLRLGVLSSIVSPTLTNASLGGTACTGAPANLTAGAEKVIALTCGNLTQGASYHGDLTFTYQQAGSNFSHTVTGTMSGSVEP